MKIYELTIDLPDKSAIKQRVSEPIFRHPAYLREFLQLTFPEVRWSMVRIHRARHFAIIVNQ